LKEGAAHRILPIANSYPIWAVIASLLILREEATSPVFVSAILVFIGAYFLIPRGKKAFNWSKVVPLAFLVAVMWGVIVVPTKYCISKGVTTSTFLAIEVISAALACDIIMSIRYLRSGIHLDKRGGGLSAFSGFLGFFVGHLLFLSALGMERASVLAPVCGAVIPFGFLLSIILLGERPSKKAILGMGIVFVGVFLATI